MKKIGIMSMQRIKNYGSFLQAYGLKKIITSLGNDVQFVDYNVEPALIEKRKKPLLVRIVKHLNPIKYVQEKRIHQEFSRRYNEEFLKLINVNEKRNYHPNIDHLIIGSDEVFNCLQTEKSVGYSRELFGKNYENMPVSTYAACCGSTTYERLVQHGIDTEVGSLINAMKHISVRDKNTYETVKKLTGRESKIHLDPVLIADFSEEIEPKEVKHKDYIIIYAYRGRISKEEQKKIKNFARKKHKKIISIGTYQEVADIHLVLDPFELLVYFKNADFVITDTFHGTIFSIKFGTNFVTMIRESNKQKLGDLLGRLELEDRISTDINNLEELYEEKIDFSKVNTILEQEKKNTFEYLKDIL